MMTPIEHLKLEHRPYFALLRAGIISIEQLVDLTESELLRVKGIARAGCYIIERALAARGLALKHESPLHDLRRTDGTLPSRGH